MPRYLPPMQYGIPGSTHAESLEINLGLGAWPEQPEYRPDFPCLGSVDLFPEGNGGKYL